MPRPIVLHDSLARKIVHDLAYNYAYMSIQRIATVRQAPPFSAASEAKWKAYRETLLSMMPELPPVEEPEWPERYLHTDWITTKSHTNPLGGFTVVDEQKLKSGAKKRPTYESGKTAFVASNWAGAFRDAVCAKGEPE